MGNVSEKHLKENGFVAKIDRKYSSPGWEMVKIMCQIIKMTEFLFVKKNLNGFTSDKTY